MARTSRTARVLKWISTTLCLLVLAAFGFSTRRAVNWDSPDSRHEVGLMLGTIGCAWRAEGWRLQDERYPPRPGWSIASYGGSPKLYWRVVSGRNKSWCWIGIPLWMPFVALALPTGILWYRDRRSVPEAIHRWSLWLTPKRPKRVTFWLVAAFCVLHVAALFLGLFAFQHLYDFFVDYRPGDRVDAVLTWAAPILLGTTPLWGLAWAWGYIRLLNRLFARQAGSHCPTCGYNLTGNVSGRCPECGERV